MPSSPNWKNLTSKEKTFGTHQVNGIESIVVEDRVLIEYGNKPPELFALSEDPRQQWNLANDPAEQTRRERLSRRLVELQQETEDP